MVIGDVVFFVENILIKQHKKINRTGRYRINLWVPTYSEKFLKPVPFRYLDR